MAQIERAFGKGSIMRLGGRNARWRSRRSRPARSGSTSRSASAGCRAGRVIEIYGPESSGKTTLTLQIIAEAQKKGGVCGFIDAEHALDPSLCAQARRQARRSADLAARQRRAGARDRRHAGALGRRRRAGHRLGGGTDARRPSSRARWATAARPPGPSHEPGPAQAHRLDHPNPAPW